MPEVDEERAVIKIRLSNFDVFWGAMVGASRHVKGFDNKPRYGADPSKSWEMNCSGAVAEMAVAKWLNVFWDGALGDYRAKDAGILQVRSTAYAKGQLLLHEADADDDITILVLCNEEPEFTLAGWIVNRLGKDRKYWKELQKGRPCFCVPQADLSPMKSCPVQPRTFLKAA